MTCGQRARPSRTERGVGWNRQGELQVALSALQRCQDRVKVLIELIAEADL
jgi:hypothetical protein